MTLPRFTADQVLNNLIIVAVCTALLLLATLLILPALAWIVRRATRESRFDALKTLGESMSKGLRAFGLVVSLVLVVAAAAALGIAIYTKADLHAWLNQTGGSLTLETGRRFGRTVLIASGVLIGALILRRILSRAVKYIVARLHAVPPLRSSEASIKTLGERLGSLVTTTALYVCFYAASSWLSLPPSLNWGVVTALNVLVVFQAARAIAMIVRLALAFLDYLGGVRLAQSRIETYYKGVRGLLPLTEVTVDAIIYLAAATLIVQQFQTLETLAPYGPRIIGILAIYFAARVLVELSRVLVYESFTRTSGLVTEVVKRRVTLIGLVQSVLKYIIYFSALLMMMRQVNIDPTPFLAGAGIVGLAVGLGSQKLVNDVVSGFFILFEGQLLTGDHVQIGSIEGDVESIQLRVTTIRDWVGRLHTIRNGDIGTIVNFSRDYTIGLVELYVPYDSDLNAVFKAMETAGARLKKAAPDQLLGDVEVWGVGKFEKHAMLVRAAFKMVPGIPYILEGDFRKMLKEAFDEAGQKMADGEQVGVRFTDGTRAQLMPMPARGQADER
jgi:small-conductance mechanosensitive channel